MNIAEELRRQLDAGTKTRPVVDHRGREVAVRTTHLTLPPDVPRPDPGSPRRRDRRAAKRR